MAAIAGIPHPKSIKMGGVAWLNFSANATPFPWHNHNAIEPIHAIHAL